MIRHLLFLCAATLAAGCDRAPLDASSEEPDEESGSCCHKALPPAHHGELPSAGQAADSGATAAAGSGELPGRSIYQLTGHWIDADGKPFSLAALRGAPVVALLFYGTCTQACPMLVHDLQRLEAKLSPSERAQTRFLLVTFDPDRDNPAALAAYRTRLGIDPSRWTLLTGSQTQTRMLAATLGVQYRALPDGSIQHSNLITLLDRDGVQTAQLEGLQQPVDGMAHNIGQLLQNTKVP